MNNNKLVWYSLYLINLLCYFKEDFCQLIKGFAYSISTEFTFFTATIKYHHFMWKYNIFLRGPFCLFSNKKKQQINES